jgi:hypothetical protein
MNSISKNKKWKTHIENEQLKFDSSKLLINKTKQMLKSKKIKSLKINNFVQVMPNLK